MAANVAARTVEAVIVWLFFFLYKTFYWFLNILISGRSSELHQHQLISHVSLYCVKNLFIFLYVLFLLTLLYVYYL